uniref:uncharacterized protein LOC124057148 n=1 Tax=Scatophagus argus TaxID=75038 RepID=UPI001ED7F225|nr:uncharacterized protein LOC124057148 [Scatophagus argus]
MTINELLSSLQLNRFGYFGYRSCLVFTLWYICTFSLRFPDIGLDESLLKYSVTNSNAVLQTYSDGLLNSLPGYIDQLASRLAPMTSVPNAVGLGALVISMIMEICITNTNQTADHTYSMLQRVFGEEKASAVRDTVLEYLRRHEAFINDDERLREETRQLERKLSYHLTTLRNSMVQDRQMSTRSLKIWVNGAFFHVQMLIHEARLNLKINREPNYIAIKTVTTFYLQDLDDLLEQYKDSKIGTKIYEMVTCGKECSRLCIIENERYQKMHQVRNLKNPCGGPELNEAFMNHVFSNYEPISGLKTHFLNVRDNLESLINQQGSFTLPSTA